CRGGRAGGPRRHDAGRGRRDHRDVHQRPRPLSERTSELASPRGRAAGRLKEQGFPGRLRSSRRRRCRPPRQPAMISLVRPPSDAAVMHAAPETPGCASHAKRWVLLATILGSSIAFLEASVINVALPAIQDALAVQVATMQWIASAYTLLLAAL